MCFLIGGERKNKKKISKFSNEQRGKRSSLCGREKETENVQRLS